MALSLGCLGRWHTLRAERTELVWPAWPAWLQIKDLRMQEHLPQVVLCLCATLATATEDPGSRRFRRVCHVSKPSLSRGSIAEKKKIDPGASAVEQARYSSELRTDGAGSVTLLRFHRSGRAAHCGN